VTDQPASSAEEAKTEALASALGALHPVEAAAFGTRLGTVEAAKAALAEASRDLALLATLVEPVPTPSPPRARVAGGGRNRYPPRSHLAQVPPSGDLGGRGRGSARSCAWRMERGAPTGAGRPKAMARAAVSRARDTRAPASSRATGRAGRRSHAGGRRCRVGELGGAERRASPSVHSWPADPHRLQPCLPSVDRWGGQPSSAGVFSDPAQPVALSPPVHAGDAVAITVEPGPRDSAISTSAPSRSPSPDPHHLSLSCPLSATHIDDCRRRVPTAPHAPSPVSPRPPPSPAPTGSGSSTGRTISTPSPALRANSARRRARRFSFGRSSTQFVTLGDALRLPDPVAPLDRSLLDVSSDLGKDLFT
jgi:hypothetical protein